MVNVIELEIFFLTDSFEIAVIDDWHTFVRLMLKKES